MNLIDAIVITLLNTITCLALPKIISVIMAAKNKRTAPFPAYQRPVKKEQEWVGAKNPCEQQ